MLDVRVDGAGEHHVLDVAADGDEVVGGQVVFDLSGAAVGEVMVSLVAIDLDPAVFSVGAAATTAVAFERAVVASAERFGVTLARDGSASSSRPM